MTFFYIAIVLFLIMDPIGNVGAYLSLVGGIPPERQRFILVREMGIAIIAKLIFNFLGEYLFQLLGISYSTVCLASGVILFLIAVKVLFPTTNGMRANLPKGEPYVTPLAIPLLAGPSLLATIMLFAHLEPSQLVMIGAIVVASLASLAVLLLANPLQRLMGNSGLLALEKLMAMILVLLAIQRIAEGVQCFFQEHKIFFH